MKWQDEVWIADIVSIAAEYREVEIKPRWDGKYDVYPKYPIEEGNGRRLEEITWCALTKEEVDNICLRLDAAGLLERVSMGESLVMTVGGFSLQPRQAERVPRCARFVLLMIPKRSREHLIGDLEEEYWTVVLPEYGLFRARLWYWGQTVFIVSNYLWPLIKRILGMAAIWKVMGG